MISLTRSLAAASVGIGIAFAGMTAAPLAGAQSISPSLPTFNLSPSLSGVDTVNSQARNAEYVGAVNAQRVAALKTPVISSMQLNNEAQAWAEHLAATGKFEHDTMRCETVGGRIMCLSENIAVAAPNATPTKVVNQWVDSPKHKENMLRSNAVLVGHGEARYTTGPKASQIVAVQRFWNVN